MPPMPVERLSFSSSMAATMEVSSTRTAEESRPKAQMPRVSIASVCHDSLRQALGRGSYYKPSPETRPVKRSEEHTSELQSRLHLVCRLLLEKKKKKWHRLDTGSDVVNSARQ